MIQNGKLVGAVTHVFVNDPTRGYGIFIENMPAEAEKIKQENSSPVFISGERFYILCRTSPATL